MKVVDVLSSKVYSSGERIIAQVWLIGVDFSIEPHPRNFCAIYGVFTLWIWWVFFPNFFLASVITSVSSLVYSGPVAQNRHDPCKCTDHNRISDPAKIFFGMERVVYSVPWSDWTFFRACLSLILQHEQTCISRKDSFRSHIRQLWDPVGWWYLCQSDSSLLCSAKVCLLQCDELFFGYLLAALKRRFWLPSWGDWKQAKNAAMSHDH